MLLQDSLGGDSKALMFCNVAPVAAHAGDTFSSLAFASKVCALVHGRCISSHIPAACLLDTQMLQQLLSPWICSCNLVCRGACFALALRPEQTHWSHRNAKITVHPTPWQQMRVLSGSADATLPSCPCR